MGEEKVGTTRQYRALCHDKSSKYVWTHNGCYDKEIRCYEVVISNKDNSKTQTRTASVTSMARKNNEENRFCEMCSENEVEDENHFLSSCPAYINLQGKHGYCSKTPKEIMDDKNPKNLSIYLSRAFKLRKKTLAKEPVSAP